MAKEQWIKWVPVDELEKKYDIIAIYYDFDGFKVIFRPIDEQKKLLQMLFESGTDCHRETNESFIYSYFENPDVFIDDPNWTFFKVKNSKYLKWLSENSHQSSDFFLIKTLCLYWPRVTTQYCNNI